MHPKLIQKNSYSKLLNGIVSQLKKQQQKTNKQSSTTVFITDNNKKYFLATKSAYYIFFLKDHVPLKIEVMTAKKLSFASKE